MNSHPIPTPSERIALCFAVWQRFAVATLLAIGCTGAAAQNYPAKPITYIFPFSPGPGDAQLRPIFEKFKERTGQPIVIDFRPGANALLATQALLRAPADGYSIGFVGASLPVNKAMFVLPFGVEDFAPITRVYEQPLALVVGPHVPANTVPEFIAWAKSRSGKELNFANTSAAAKLMMHVMREKTGLPYLEIPFKGTPESMLAVMSGNADFHFLTLNDSATALAKEGKIKILAVATEKRTKDYPDIPAVNEFAPGFVVKSWTGIMARAKTPPQFIDFLFKELTFALKQPDVLQKMGVAGRAVGVSSSPEEFAQEIRNDAESFVRIAKAAGIVPQSLQ